MLKFLAPFRAPPPQAAINTGLKAAFVAAAVLSAAVYAAPAVAAGAGGVPDLTGKWHGYSQQVTAAQGYRTSQNTIEITSQNGRRFMGAVTHSGITEKFIGILRSDNKTLYWVDTADDGHVVGEIVRPGVIETCYLDAGKDAVVACTLLVQEP